MAKSRVQRTSRWIIAIPAALGGAGIGAMWGLLALAVAGMRGGAVPGWLPVATAVVTGAAAWLYRALLMEGAGRLGPAAGAMPILARIAERHAGTQPAQWAARRLADLRAEVWLTDHDDAPGWAAD